MMILAIYFGGVDITCDKMELLLIRGKTMLEKYEGVILPQESIKMIQEEVQTLGTDCYLHSGMYNFKVDPGDDRQVVEARFSFVWKKDDQGEWKTVHHHSSAKSK